MKAQPDPIVSGKYFFPNAPLLCLKRMPASAVTSANSIAPLGRGGVGLADGDGDAVATSLVGALVVASGVFLQETIKSRTDRRIMIRGRIGVKSKKSDRLHGTFTRFPPDFNYVCCWTNNEQCVERSIDNLHQSEDEFREGNQEHNQDLSPP